MIYLVGILELFSFWLACIWGTDLLWYLMCDQLDKIAEERNDRTT